jgi:hypothetical protein
MVQSTYEGGTRRYRLLETMRDYARVRLREAGDEASARRAHAEFFSGAASDLAASFGEGSEEEWAATYEPDVANFRAALDWAIAEDAALAARLIGNLTDLWAYTRFDVEGLRYAKAGLTALGTRREGIDAIPVLLAIADLSWHAGDAVGGIDAGERAFEIASRVNDKPSMARARFETGRLRMLVGTDPERAESDLKEAAQYVAVASNAVRAADVATFYAIALAVRDPHEGRRLLAERVEALQLAAWPRALMRAEYSLAEIDFSAGDVTSAIERSRRAIDLLRRRKDPLTLAHSLHNLASYLSIAGDYAAATEAASEALTIGRLYGRERRVALAGQALALVNAAGGGDALLGARLLGYADAFYDRIRAKRETTEANVASRARALLEKRLGASDLELAVAQGRALSMEGACAIALGEGAAAI